MADKTMHHVVIGSDTYEIVDSVARENVSVALSAYPTDTASGAVATFSDGADNVPVKSLSVGIEPAQSGSGDPSPSNVRPISGWDKVHVYVDAVHGTHDKTYTVDLPQTVYGGTLDVSTGELTIDKAAADLGTLTWQTNTSGVFYANGTSLGYLHNNSQAAICSKYLYNGSGNSSSVVASGPDKTVYLNLHWGGGWVFIKDTTYTDATAFKASLSGVQLVYEVDTPTTLTLTPEQVTTLLGDNNIYADSGEVNVTYRADTGLYIQKVINA